MTSAAKIAWAIIAAALAGWIGSFWLPDVWWTTVVRHACEGAFVGGVCDAFAIWKVYGKAEDNFERLTDEVADTFIVDMVRPEEVVAELSEKLHEPAFAREMLAHVETLVPSQDTVRTFLADVWEETIRDHVIERLVGLDLREAFQEEGDGGRLAQEIWGDPLIHDMVRRCLTRAVSDPASSARLYRSVLKRYGKVTVFEIPGIPVVKPSPTPVSLEAMARYTMDEDELHARLLAAVDGAFEGAGGGDGPMAGALRDYGHAYASAWGSTDPAERRQAAARLVSLLTPPALDALSGWIWQHRTRLSELSHKDLPLNAHPLVEYVSDEVGEMVGERLSLLDARSQELLTEKLREMGPKPFRQMLERRTRPELDWIQVNGAGLGFFLGLAAGLIASFMH